MKNKIFFSLLSLILILLFSCISVLAQEDLSEEKICTVYITGVGCPNCAFTDPVLLSEFTNKYPNLIAIEYEIYHQHESNMDVANEYFDSYIPVGRPGIPFLIFDKQITALGRFAVLDSKQIIEKIDSNECPLSDGSSIDFRDLDITALPGKPKIWAKNRVLIRIGDGGNNKLLKSLLTSENLSSTLEGIKFEKIKAQPIPISDAKIEFENAVKIDNWIFQWNGKAKLLGGISEILKPGFKGWYWAIILAIFLLVLFLTYKFFIKRREICFVLSDRQKNFLVIGISLIILIGFFILAKIVSPEFLKQMGYSLPLPLFTFFIALIDGFNPCTLFVLTVLLGLLISVSHSRKKIYIIGYTFVFIVFVIYFLFMVAWLNIFKFIGFIDPLRIAIAIIALVAGVINCKELLFFRKGITLMVQEKHKMPLLRKIEHMKGIILRGTIPAMISASIFLAVFASLVELPCTAGFPIIYTGILTGKVLGNSLSYYSYLLLYNLVYIMPLATVIGIFGYTFKGKQISKRQMQIIKFIGGLIMILLGIILLVNPSLIMVS